MTKESAQEFFFENTPTVYQTEIYAIIPYIYTPRVKEHKNISANTWIKAYQAYQPFTGLKPQVTPPKNETSFKCWWSKTQKKMQQTNGT